MKYGINGLFKFLLLRHQGVNQKIMCYDSKDNNINRFQLLIIIVYPMWCRICSVKNLNSFSHLGVNLGCIFILLSCKDG